MEGSHPDHHKSAARLAGSTARHRINVPCRIGSCDYAIRSYDNLASRFRSPTLDEMPVGASAKQGEVSEVSRSRSHSDMNDLDLERLSQNSMFWLPGSPP